MENTDVLGSYQWHLSAYDSPWVRIEADTIIYTWVVLGIIALISCIIRCSLLWYPDSMLSFVIKWCVRVSMRAIEHSCHKLPQRYISFFSALFIFLLISNCLIVIPTFEEPTKDLNTALALSIAMFLFVQLEAIYHHGLMVYLNDLFKTPIAVRGVYATVTIGTSVLLALRVLANIVLGILLFPLELLGKLSGVISLAFRLFGNILAGSVIATLWLRFRSGSWILQLLGLLTGFNLLIMVFFGIFEGAVQAFVFVMLGLSSLGRALQSPE
jgi:F-type H+-transporting ATPase subunit a